VKAHNGVMANCQGDAVTTSVDLEIDGSLATSAAIVLAPASTTCNEILGQCTGGCSISIDPGGVFSLCCDQSVGCRCIRVFDRDAGPGSPAFVCGCASVVTTCVDQTLAAGTHIVFASLDPQDAIAEFDETDNTITVMAEVRTVEEATLELRDSVPGLVENRPLARGMQAKLSRAFEFMTGGREAQAPAHIAAFMNHLLALQGQIASPGLVPVYLDQAGNLLHSLVATGRIDPDEIPGGPLRHACSECCSIDPQGACCTACGLFPDVAP
jgi:hypothetical protein